jgi:ferredoxin
MIDIYYYSGRGNSLFVARELARDLPDARLMPAPGAARGFAIPAPEDRAIGLVFPVIDFGIPASIRALISRFRRPAASPYVFVALTNGGMPAGAIGQARRLLKRRGLRLAAGVQLRFSLRPEDEGLRARKIAALKEAVRGRREAEVEAGSLFDRAILTGALNLLARLTYPKDDGKFEVDSSCDGCGTCAELCPSGNIAIEADRPVWKGRCEQCGACFAWCPREAISGACLAARTRYTHPEISLADMLQAAGLRARERMGESA